MQGAEAACKRRVLVGIDGVRNDLPRDLALGDAAPRMEHHGLGRKDDGGAVGLEAFEQVAVFHAGEGKVLVEAADGFEHAAPHQHVARPKLAAGGVQRRMVVAVGSRADGMDGAFQHVGLRGGGKLLQVGREKVGFEVAVVVEEEDPLGAALPCAVVAVHRRAACRAGDVVHGRVGLVHLLGQRRSVAIIGDGDRRAVLRQTGSAGLVQRLQQPQQVWHTAGAGDDDVDAGHGRLEVRGAVDRAWRRSCSTRYTSATTVAVSAVTVLMR